MIKRLLSKKAAKKKAAAKLPTIPRIGGTMGNNAMDKKFDFKTGKYKTMTTSSAHGITARRYRKGVAPGGKEYAFVRRSWTDDWVRTDKFFDFQKHNSKRLAANAEALIGKKLGPPAARRTR